MIAELASEVEDRPQEVDNRTIAAAFLEVASLLESQAANPFRIHAYRAAAQVVRALGEPAAELLERAGFAGLKRLPGIGESLAHAIEELVRTGRWKTLERLRGVVFDDDPIAELPTIGPMLADRIRQHLGIETLEDLEAAAYDGRLMEVPGFGLKRVRAVRDTLAGRFGRRPPSTKPRPPRPSDPPVAELLDIDREYRDKSAKGRLPSAAPKRFNPTGAAWLPILHTERGARHYTVLFSNSARAHEVESIHDWVIIVRDDEGGRGQWTVVTSRYGRLKGRRVVRGREEACRQHYDGALSQRKLPLAEADA